ncbi:MAG: terminase small subunit [Archangium sp.]
MSPKQAAFVQAYVVDLNATAAAKAAGYSAKTAESQGSRLLRNAKVKKAVDEALGEKAKRNELKADDVLRELGHIGFSDPIAAFDAKTGALLEWAAMPPAMRRAIASFEVENVGEGKLIRVTKVKLWPKVTALELLGKNFKLWVDKMEHHHTVPISVVDPYATPKGG